MGILGLLKFIRDKFPKGWRKTTLKEYKGKRFAIDASVAIHAYVAAEVDVGDGFIKLILRLRHHSIVPVFVFDGPSGRRKALTKQKRDIDKKTKIDKYNDMLANPEEYTADEQERIRKGIRMTTREDADKAKKACQAMGVSWIQSPGESDFVMAILSRRKIVDGVFSVDSDMLTHKVDCLVTKLAFQNDGPLDEYSRPTILKEMKMTDDEFTDFCVMLGTDYSKKIMGVGPITAYDMMCQHGSLKAVIDAIKADPKGKYKVPTDNFDIPDTVAAFVEDDPDSAETVRLFVETEDASEAEAVDTPKLLKEMGYDTKMAQRIAESFAKGWLINEFSLRPPPCKFGSFGKKPAPLPSAPVSKEAVYDGVTIVDKIEDVIQEQEQMIVDDSLGNQTLPTNPTEEKDIDGDSQMSEAQ